MSLDGWQMFDKRFGKMFREMKVWPGTPPVWGLDGDLYKKRPKFAKNVKISSKWRFGGDFTVFDRFSIDFR